MPSLIDLSGQKFGRLTAIDRDNRDSKHTYWNCQCECGNKLSTRSDNLRGGKTMSCGCLNLEIVTKMSTIHGMHNQEEYSIWESMIQRCTNPNKDHYIHYGGRGITVCERWKNFENFYEDMGQRPKGMSLDRIDNNGNYEPGNCRWATRSEQSRNQRSNVMIEFQGKTQCLVDWAKETGISKSTLSYRLSKPNWSIERALTTTGVS